MSELKFDIHVNSSEFIEKTEQIRSAIRATSSEIEEQEKRIGLSFQQMADKAGLTANVMGNAIKEMHKQISDAIISLNKLDSENQERLANLRNKMGEFSTKPEAGKTSDNGTRGDVLTQKGSVQSELNSRENLSVDTEEQQKILAELNNELLTYQKELESAQNELSALRVEMTSVCEEMEQMRNAGEQNTEAYAKLKDKSIDLTDSMKETNEQLAKASDPNAGFEGVNFLAHELFNI